MTDYQYRITATLFGKIQYGEWFPVTHKDDSGQLTLQRDALSFADNGITFTIEVKPITPRPPRP